MSNVVAIQPKPKDTDFIYVCNCGCASFELRGDGAAICRNCFALADDGGWKEKADGDAAFEGAETYSDAGNDASFAEHKIKRDVQDAEWIIAGTDAGRVISWARNFIETPEQEAWLRDGVNRGLEAVLQDKPR